MAYNPREYKLIVADSTEMALTRFQADRGLRRGKALNRLVVMALQGLGYLPFLEGQPRVKIVEQETPQPPSLAELDVKFARDNWWQASEKFKKYYLEKYPDQFADLTSPMRDKSKLGRGPQMEEKR